MDSVNELLYDLTIDSKQLKDVSQIPEYFDVISKM